MHADILSEFSKIALKLKQQQDEDLA